MWYRGYRSLLILLSILGSAVLFWHCSQTVDALRTCTSQTDCLTDQFCIQNVCVSTTAGHDGSTGNNEPTGQNGYVELLQENPIPTEQPPSPDETKPQDTAPEATGEQGGQEPNRTESHQDPEDVDQDGSPVIQKDAGSEDIFPDDTMGRERLFVPEPPDENRPPLPDEDIDPERGGSSEPGKEPVEPDENTGRFPEVRPEQVSESSSIDHATVSDQRFDPNASCTSGESRKCYPEGTEGCNKNTGMCVGRCDWGKQSCTNGTWGNCVGAKTPEPEKCNQQDDNCDGMIDEGGRCP